MSMIKIRRANVILNIPEEQADEYLSKGFDVIGEDGMVVKHTTATNDVRTLMKRLEEANMTIKKLEEKIEMLEQELDEVADGEEGEPTTKKKSSKK